LDYFVIGVILSFLFCHSEGAQATEESARETLRLRLRVTKNGGHPAPPFSVILTLLFCHSFTSLRTSSDPPFFVILTLSEAKGKNLILFTKQVLI